MAGVISRLVWIPVLAALIAVGLVSIPPPAHAAASPQVILFDTVDYGVVVTDPTHIEVVGQHKVITRSQPDLRRLSWSGIVSSLTIRGGISVAVYSEPNYRGTCSTFTNADPWLGNDRIGNDRAASVRFFDNCAGRVIDPVVTAMTVAESPDEPNVQCPVSDVRRDRDLNDGAGGDYIYLCLHYESNASSGYAAVTTVQALSGWTPVDNTCRSGATYVGGDLNEGAGGLTVHLCYWTFISPHPDPAQRTYSPLRNMEFISPAGVVTDENMHQWCSSRFQDVESGAVTSDHVDFSFTDLNGSGGDDIRPCMLHYSNNLGPVAPDVTPPLIGFVGADPSPNQAGWNNSGVTLRWKCSDDHGVMAPLAKAYLGSEGANQSAMGLCEDTSGNVATDTQTGIDIDLTKPYASPNGRTPPNAAGWNNTDVEVSWNCKDQLSGPARAVVTVWVRTEGRDQSATGSCADRAGNTSSQTADGNPDTVDGINIDKTAPTIVGTATAAPNGFGWYRGDVTVSWTCADEGGSGLSGPCPADSVITGEGSGQAAHQSVSDRAGNIGHGSVAVAIDRTAPAMSDPTRTPAPNAMGWNKGDVIVTWRCSDGLSGPPTSTVSDRVRGEGRKLEATGTCQDHAGNSTHDSVYGIKIDRTAPALRVAATTADHQPYEPGTWTNQDVIVRFTCKDKLSGVASVSGPTTLSSEGADQSVVGSCADNAGNRVTAGIDHINIDKASPKLTCRVEPGTLWPPNHRLVPVSASVGVSDGSSGPGTFELAAATSSEPDDGPGDGNTAGDIRGFRIGTADTTGELRAERSGLGDGRVYTLTYRATDRSGNGATCSVRVRVAHDGSA